MPEPSGHRLHSRLCKLIEDASTLWSHLSFAVYHFMVRRCCPFTRQESILHASHNVIVHTVCPYGQHVHICALMRECQAGCCSCCILLSAVVKLAASV